MKVVCKTLFDCSVTGVTGHFRPSQVPFRDRTGVTVNDQTEWNRSRNQQRNWETLLQILSLRAQPDDIRWPKKVKNCWEFEFEVAEEVYGDNFALLVQDCQGVPMVINLNETVEVEPMLITNGPNQNIWFDTINNGYA